MLHSCRFGLCKYSNLSMFCLNYTLEDLKVKLSLVFTLTSVSYKTTSGKIKVTMVTSKAMKYVLDYLKRLAFLEYFEIHNTYVLIMFKKFLTRNNTGLSVSFSLKSSILQDRTGKLVVLSGYHLHWEITGRTFQKKSSIRHMTSLQCLSLFFSFHVFSLLFILFS